MSKKEVKRLYYGDNLEVLRNQVLDESVDLVYLDPPFNSKATYNVLFSSPKGQSSEAQIEAFEDTWHWGEDSERLLSGLKSSSGELAEFLDFLVRSLNKNDLSAYLVMMAARLVELHKVLKPTGSLYLHCDPTASHYLKIILDIIFGVENYRNEIVWKRTNVHSDSKTWSKVSDIIYFYTKSEKFTWNPVYEPYSKEYLSNKYRYKDPDGRIYRLDNMTSPSPRPNMMYEWKGFPHPPNGWRYSKEKMQKLDEENRIHYPEKKSQRPQLKRYLDEMQGTLMGNMWTDINPINSQARERLGYPTQKPLALLGRIIQVSSNEGDIVLDPFCGCGTAVHAAEKLKRNWMGIDITHLSISLIEKRLRDAFPDIKFEVEGVPKDLPGAVDLAERDKYQFQWWACSLVNAQPFGGKKKGADKGIDGIIYFSDYDSKKGSSEIKKIIVSVKGGKNISVPMIRDLVGTMGREKAEIGLFITLTSPTKPMIKEAALAGLYKGSNQQDYPKIQILTIEGLLSGAEKPKFIDLNIGQLNFRKAAQEDLDAIVQTNLF